MTPAAPVRARQRAIGRWAAAVALAGLLLLRATSATDAAPANELLNGSVQPVNGTTATSVRLQRSLQQWQGQRPDQRHGRGRQRGGAPDPAVGLRVERRLSRPGEAAAGRLAGHLPGRGPRQRPEPGWARPDRQPGPDPHAAGPRPGRPRDPRPGRRPSRRPKPSPRPPASSAPHRPSAAPQTHGPDHAQAAQVPARLAERSAAGDARAKRA